MVATKTVLDEAYANGDFTSGKAAEYFLDGNSGIKELAGFKYFDLAQLAYRVFSWVEDTPQDGENLVYVEKIGELSGTPFVKYTDESGDSQYNFDIFPIAPVDSDATALTADGFIAMFIPDGYESGKPGIVVTYRLDPVEGLATLSEFIVSLTSQGFTYNESQGYEVYQLTIDETPEPED
jgi:hypothetical protein